MLSQFGFRLSRLSEKAAPLQPVIPAKAGIYLKPRCIYRLALLTGGSIAASSFVPDGVEILDEYAQLIGAACAACGCPQSGSPRLEALVRLGDVPAMRDVGWIEHR